MIESYMPLVDKKLEFFLREFPRFNYLREDLRSAGYVGLIEGIDKLQDSFEPRAREAFLSIHILEAFQTCISQEMPVQVPSRSYRQLKSSGKPLPNITTMRLDDIAVDASKEFELLEEIYGCCDCDIEREIVRLRLMGHKDHVIAEMLDLTHYTIYMTRRAIYARFLERNPEIKGEA